MSDVFHASSMKLLCIYPDCANLATRNRADKLCCQHRANEKKREAAEATRTMNEQQRELDRREAYLQEMAAQAQKLEAFADRQAVINEDQERRYAEVQAQRTAAAARVYAQSKPFPGYSTRSQSRLHAPPQAVLMAPPQRPEAFLMPPAVSVSTPLLLSNGPDLISFSPARPSAVSNDPQVLLLDYF